MNLTEKTHPVTAIAPATNAGALAGDYISMSKTGHVTVQVLIAQGHATQPVITLHQATGVAGTGNKVLEKDIAIKYVADAAASDVMVAQADDVDFTPDVALKHKVILFEVPVEALDMDNDFCCLQVRVAASNAANIVSATYWCSEERYHGKSKIVD